MSIELNKKINLEERDMYIRYIDEHIDEMSYDDRRNILSMLKMSLDNKKFKEKGDGTQILYHHISNDLIIWIRNLIYSKINAN
jgi:hypothetical protein